MKYKISWHDADDDRSGHPFDVEANSPAEAYHLADQRIRGWVRRYVSADIERLEDTTGVVHWPENFLAGSSGRSHVNPVRLAEAVCDSLDDAISGVEHALTHGPFTSTEARLEVLSSMVDDFRTLLGEETSRAALELVLLKRRHADLQKRYEEENEDLQQDPARSFELPNRTALNEIESRIDRLRAAVEAQRRDERG